MKRNKILIILCLFLCIVSLTFNIFAAETFTLSNDNEVTFLNMPENIKSEIFLFYVTSSNIGNRYYLFTYDSTDGQLACSNPSTGNFVFLDANNNLSKKLDIYYISASSAGKDVEFTFHQTTASFNWGENLSGYYSTKTIYRTKTTSAPYTVTNVVAFEGTQKEPPFENPSFITTEENLSSGKFENLKIDAGSLDNADNKLVLQIYQKIDIDSTISDYKLQKSILLDNTSSNEYFNVADLQVYYVIPQAKLGIDISNNKSYMFQLKEYAGDTIYNETTFTIAGLTTDEEIQNAEDEQTEAIKENTETNKGIWETIKDILSYINPFSENFFVYKLIELLIEAIKSLFLPADGFFDTYFTELREWFSNRLGFLFYPFELIIDILTKMLNINFAEPVFNIPDINEPFTNTKLISSTTYNLNSLLENDVFKNLHNIYLLCVDAFIIFELVGLFRRKYEEVTTK